MRRGVPSRSRRWDTLYLWVMAASDAESTHDNSPKGTKDRPGGPGRAARKDKPLPPSARKKKQAEARRSASSASGTVSDETGGGRYTAPIPAAKKGPSPRWVPVLMFALWGVGLAMILLNYMGLLPGSADGGNGWYLMGGLGLILAGIVTATQYR